MGEDRCIAEHSDTCSTLQFVIMSCAIVISESATVRAGDPRARSCAQIYYHVRWAHRFFFFYCFANFRVADNACPTTAGDMKAPNPFADTKLAGHVGCQNTCFSPHESNGREDLTQRSVRIACRLCRVWTLSPYLNRRCVECVCSGRLMF